MGLSTINGSGGGTSVERGEGEAARARIPAVVLIVKLNSQSTCDNICEAVITDFDFSYEYSSHLSIRWAHS